MAANGVPFSKQMREATRDVHALSDALVNAKLAFALSDNGVWAEGLLIFYEIFRYLEDAMLRLKGTPVGDFYIDGLARTEAFEKDLKFYLGDNWADNYVPRESVAEYLLHLRHLEKSKPILLVAYIYHLYMGLLSGGQILTKKRALVQKIIPGSRELNNTGYAVTTFENTSIANLKRQFVNILNTVALTLDDKTKQELLEESRNVFVMNNKIIKTVRGTTHVIFNKVAIFITLIVMIYFIYFILYVNKF